MTSKSALKKARELWGKNAAVQMDPRGARIGAHGEYIPGHIGNRDPDSPHRGRYRCAACSETEVCGGDLVERHVWHQLGGFQASYRVGRIDLGMFFTTLGEGESYEKAFAKATTRKAVA